MHMEPNREGVIYVCIYEVKTEKTYICTYELKTENYPPVYAYMSCLEGTCVSIRTEST